MDADLQLESDQEISLRILEDAQESAQWNRRKEVSAERYWHFLVLGAGFCGVGILLLKERVQLVWLMINLIAVALSFSWLL